MGIGPAETEGVYSHHKPLPLRQRFGLGYHPQVKLIEINPRIGSVEMKIRRDAAVLQHEQHLGPACDGGSRFEMAEVAFHRADGEWLAFGPRLSKSLSDGPCFDGISDSCASSMGFQIVEV